MYCQSCGSQNTTEAKFCNQCGARIASAGEADGPMAASATVEDPPAEPRNEPSTTQTGGPPPPAAAPRPNAYHPDTGFGGPSMMSVSLAAIGVRSSKKIWGVMGMIAVTLIGLGWLGSWLARGEPEVITEAGHAEPDDPFVIGTPLPEGDDAPEVDYVSGSMGTADLGSELTSGMTTASPMTGRAAPTMSSMTASMTTTPSMTASMTTTPSMTASMTTTTMDTTMDTTTMDTTTMDTTTMDTTTNPTSMGNPPDDGPEERDIEMELYSSRVRFVIRRYYAARAQTCFDRATRNSPTVSGTVVISMSIGADGTIARARTSRNTTGDENLGRCLQGQVSTWRLPPPPGGGLDMNMPFSR